MIWASIGADLSFRSLYPIFIETKRRFSGFSFWCRCKSFKALKMKRDKWVTVIQQRALSSRERCGNPSSEWNPHSAPSVPTCSQPSRPGGEFRLHPAWGATASEHVLMRQPKTARTGCLPPPFRWNATSVFYATGFSKSQRRSWTRCQ